MTDWHKQMSEVDVDAFIGSLVSVWNKWVSVLSVDSQ